MAASSECYLDKGFRYHTCQRAMTFYTSAYLCKLGPEGFSEKDKAACDAGFRAVPIPEDAQFNTFADQVTVELRSDWMTFKAGSLLVAPAVRFMAMDAGAPVEERERSMTPLFVPTERSSLDSWHDTEHYLVLNVLDNVRTELRFLKYDLAAGSWKLESSIKGDNCAALDTKADRQQLQR